MAVRIAAIAAFFVCSPLLCNAAANEAPTLIMNAQGEIQIAPDGNVSDYRLTSKLPDAVAALVDKEVRRWQFEPVVIDGAAVVAKTRMHLSLKAEPAGTGDQYRVSITDIRFGEPRRGGGGRIRPPHYPMAAVRAHLSAVVMLAVKFDETGKVTDAIAYQTSIDKRTSSEADAERWRKEFEEASITAARSWQYDVAETVNGRPVSTTALLPVTFTLQDMGAPPPAAGAWKAYLQGPVHEVPWLKDNHVADAHDLSKLGDGEALALDSRFHLKQDVVGSTL